MTKGDVPTDEMTDLQREFAEYDAAYLEEQQMIDTVAHIIASPRMVCSCDKRDVGRFVDALKRAGYMIEKRSPRCPN